MKEVSKQRPKTQIKVVSVVEMTSDAQVAFERAVNASLIDLIRSLDRRDTGEADGSIEEQRGRVGRDRRRSPE
jgi:hypothetical protein